MLIFQKGNHVPTRIRCIFFAFSLAMQSNIGAILGQRQCAQAEDETVHGKVSSQHVRSETGLAIKSDSDLKKQLVLSEYQEKETQSYKIWSEKGQGNSKFLPKNWPPGSKSKSNVLLPSYRQFMILAKDDLTVAFPDYGFNYAGFDLRPGCMAIFRVRSGVGEYESLRVYCLLDAIKGRVLNKRVNLQSGDEVLVTNHLPQWYEINGEFPSATAKRAVVKASAFIDHDYVKQPDGTTQYTQLEQRRLVQKHNITTMRFKLLSILQREPLARQLWLGGLPENEGLRDGLLKAADESNTSSKERFRALENGEMFAASVRPNAGHPWNPGLGLEGLVPGICTLSDVVAKFGTGQLTEESELLSRYSFRDNAVSILVRKSANKVESLTLNPGTGAASLVAQTIAEATTKYGDLYLDPEKSTGSKRILRGYCVEVVCDSDDESSNKVKSIILDDGLPH
jgi:hypothetical protein